MMQLNESRLVCWIKVAEKQLNSGLATRPDPEMDPYMGLHRQCTYQGDPRSGQGVGISLSINDAHGDFFSRS